jgi:hypothetical protein
MSLIGRAVLMGEAVQGRRDLNPQPSVLETDALPVELLPFGGFSAMSRRDPTSGQGMARQGQVAPVAECTWRVAVTSNP